jgi:hypothetical protein
MKLPKLKYAVEYYFTELPSLIGPREGKPPKPVTSFTRAHNELSSNNQHVYCRILFQ